MTDEEIVLYFNEHRLAKLESYLLKDGSSVEHELQNLLVSMSRLFQSMSAWRWKRRSS